MSATGEYAQAAAPGRDPSTVPITEVALPNGGAVPGFTAARPTTTFGDLCDGYHADAAKTLRRSTHRESVRKVANLIKPLYGRRAPETMTVPEMREWEEKLVRPAGIKTQREH